VRIATTHAAVEGKVRPIAPFDSDNTNPAGGINSCAEDMAKWVRTLLAEGALPDGSRLFSKDTYKQITTLVTPIQIGNPPPELAATRSSFNGYALGLGTREYRGHRILTHTGGLPGYLSLVIMVPDLQLGVAVLTNQESGEAFSSIGYSIVDSYLEAAATPAGAKVAPGRTSEAPKTDWVDAYQKVSARQKAAVAESERKASAARDAGAGPSLPLEKYAHLYRDAWYGDIVLTLEGGKLVMRFSHTPSLVGDLEHWQHDTFVVRWRDRELRADAFVTFALNPDGSVREARMEPVSAETDFSFDFQDLLLAPAK
jgi:hypothetical protein